MLEGNKKIQGGVKKVETVSLLLGGVLNRSPLLFNNMLQSRAMDECNGRLPDYC